MNRTDPPRKRRRSIRLPGHDYTSPGCYFVTICVQGGQCLLGEVVEGDLVPSAFGRVVQDYWQRIPQRTPHVVLDASIVMPNHLHGILVITDRRSGSRPVPALAPDRSTRQLIPPTADPAGVVASIHGPPSGSLGFIVGNFKSVTTRRVNQMRNTPGVRFWQRNYWEHVIRNEAALDRIRRYIQGNPSSWEEDRLHPLDSSKPSGIAVK